MNAVLYFSGTGGSKKVAEKLAARLDMQATDIIELYRCGAPLEFERVAVVFPVYSQGVPSVLKPVFKKLRADYAAIIATYGRMGAGNAIYEAAQLINAEICAAAYIPAKHSYIEGDGFNAPDVPEEIINKLREPTEICLPRRKKSPFASLAPDLRSRIAVKILRNAQCNSCGICTHECPTNAINDGKINQRCIRCLKCVRTCPQGALEVKYSRVLKRYLKRKKTEETILYT